MIPSRNIYGTLIPNELDEEANVDPADLENHYTFCTYATTQRVLLCASSTKKVAFLYELFVIIERHKFIRMIFNILEKHFLGKLYNYLKTMDYSDNINDAQFKDNDRSIDPDELDACFESSLYWFKYLHNIDLKLAIFLSYLSICGNSVIRKVIIRVKKFYEKEGNYFRHSRLSTHFSFQLQPSARYYAYNEELDDSDPDVQLIYKKRKEWDEMITKYRKNVEFSIYGCASDPKFKEENAKQGENGKTRTDKSKNKKDTTLKEGKGKKIQKSETADTKKPKSEMDMLQLLPIWITMKIFKHLDNKTLKLVKDVNKYWSFVVDCINQEEKGRKKLDDWIESIENDLGLKDYTAVFPSKFKPEFRFRRQNEKNIACDLRVHNSLREETNITLQPTHFSALSNIVNSAEFDFRMPVNELQSFRRMLINDVDNSMKFLHTHPSCIHYDNVTTKAVPISEIPLTGKIVEEFNTQKETSYDYIPLELKEAMDRSLYIESNKIQPRFIRWFPLTHMVEIDEVMNSIVQKSMVNVKESKPSMRYDSFMPTISMADMKASNDKDIRSFESKSDPLVANHITSATETDCKRGTSKKSIPSSTNMCSNNNFPLDIKQSIRNEINVESQQLDTMTVSENTIGRDSSKAIIIASSVMSPPRFH
ncbi:uncharacterized protein [Atheta coriaria]|uniref:uncharacterized protein isoform X1 n=1 Tax=Dalotia coriaria TaxID=877792 RepID=UPI0031F35172